MKRKAQIIGSIVLLAASIGCQTQTHQQPPRPAVSQQSASPVVSRRDMVLAIYGNQNPGSEWEQKSLPGSGVSWERHVTVKVDVSTSAFPGWGASSGAKFCSLSISQLGTLPLKEIYIGPINAIGIETGATQARMPTSSGVMLMLVVDPTKTEMRWTEQ